MTAIGFVLDLLNPPGMLMPFFLFGGLFGTFAGWLVHLVLTGQIRRPVPVGAIAGGLAGCAAVFVMDRRVPPLAAALLGAPLGAWVGFGAAHLLRWLGHRGNRTAGERHTSEAMAGQDEFQNEKQRESEAL